MNTYTTSPANGYRKPLSMDCEEFTLRDLKDAAVENFFEEFEKPYGITSNVIGYILDKNNETIGYIEEHYVDSGSVDYYYTAFIHG